MKFNLLMLIIAIYPVASCVEAWIEILRFEKSICEASVASCVEAWIEIIMIFCIDINSMGRLLRGGVD